MQVINQPVSKDPSTAVPDLLQLPPIPVMHVKTYNESRMSRKTPQVQKKTFNIADILHHSQVLEEQRKNSHIDWDQGTSQIIPIRIVSNYSKNSD